MKKLFVPYEIALKLKELGFNEECFGEYRQFDGDTPYLQLYQDIDSCSTDDADYCYTTECLAPLYQQVIDWFREKEIKIIENPSFGWDMYLELDDNYFLNRSFYTLDEAIKESFKQI